jgi:hypothetical protein
LAFMWFAPNPTRARRLFIVAVLLFGPAVYLYVWCRLTPRWYTGTCDSRLGVLVTRGQFDFLERGA